jgi:hypothetical protein
LRFHKDGDLVYECIQSLKILKSQKGLAELILRTFDEVDYEHEKYQCKVGQYLCYIEIFEDCLGLYINPRGEWKLSI